jgi:hypothetical protein
MVNRIVLTLFIVSLSSSAIFAQGYQGKDFWVAFPQNARAENNSGLSLIIYIAASEDVAGTIVENRTGVSTPFKVAAGKTYQFKADSINQTNLTGIWTSSFHITSSKDVSVIALTHRRASTDSYAAIPTQYLGSKYIVNGYEKMGSESLFTTQFNAIATEDNTTITIQYPTIGSSVASVQKQYSLQKGDVYYESSSKYKEYNHDLSGTVVSSDKPIAFITGHQCAQVPKDANFCDVLVEMIPPIEDLGTEYVIPELPQRKASSIRVVAAKPNTKVILNDKLLAVLPMGGIYQNDSLIGNNVIQTSEPAYLYQYSQGAATDGFSDPDLILIPPTDRYMSSTTVNVPHINSLEAERGSSLANDHKLSDIELMVKNLSKTYDILRVEADTVIFKVKGDTSNVRGIYVKRPDPEEVKLNRLIPDYQPPAIYESENGWHHWITIITESPEDSKVMINGKPLDPTAFKQVFTSRFYVLQKNLSPGVYTFTSQKPAVFFSYGYGVSGDNYDSYGHTCGMNLFIGGR